MYSFDVGLENGVQSKDEYQNSVYSCKIHTEIFHKNISDENEPPVKEVETSKESHFVLKAALKRIK